MFEPSNIYFSIAGFLFSAAIILFSGTKLAKYGDLIAELTGWGKAWVGLILMAAVTSLPELISGISSVAVIDAPDLAAGDIFGSCIFNLLILSIMDFQIKQPLTSIIKTSHLYAGLFGIILIAMSGIAILTDELLPQVLWFSPFSVILILVYFVAVRSIYRFDKSFHDSPVREHENNKRELKKAVTGYVFNAVLVILAALFLPVFGEALAAQGGMGNTFFGTLFLAASTSMPEVVVSLMAIRLRAFDMAVGNILGSNIFNIFILAIDDVFYASGSLFRAIDHNHIISIMFVTLMTAIAGLGMMTKSGRTFWKLGADTLVILILYLCLLSILFLSE